MPRVDTCIVFDDATGTCTESAWLEQPSFIPRMTVEQGNEIGQSILLALVSVAVIKVFLGPKLQRSAE